MLSPRPIAASLSLSLTVVCAGLEPYQALAANMASRGSGAPPSFLGRSPLPRRAPAQGTPQSLGVTRIASAGDMAPKVAAGALGIQAGQVRARGQSLLGLPLLASSGEGGALRENLLGLLQAASGDGPAEASKSQGPGAGLGRGRHARVLEKAEAIARGLSDGKREQASLSVGSFTLGWRHLWRAAARRALPAPAPSVQAPSSAGPEAAASSTERPEGLLRLAASGAVSLFLAAAPFLALSAAALAGAGLTPIAWLGLLGAAAGARAGASLSREFLRRFEVSGRPYGAGMVLGVAAPAAALAGAAALLAGWSVPLAAAALSVAAASEFAARVSAAVKARQGHPAVGPDPVKGQAALFPLVSEGGKTFLALGSEHFNTPYLLSATLERGLGEKWLYSSLMLGNFIFYFERAGEQVQLVAKNMSYRAPEGTPLAKAVELSVPDSVVVKARAARREGERTLVELDGLFLQDILRINPYLNKRYRGYYQPDADLTRLEQAKAYPRNLEIRSRLAFSRQPGQPLAVGSSVPDPTNLSLVLRYSLSALPKQGYRPRPADDRLGHFVEVFEDLAEAKAKDRTRRLIQRWRLEKQDPSAELSAVKEPIVFWLEDTIPEEFRETVRQAALKWNKAFEAGGFKGAIVVKDQPKKPAAQAPPPKSLRGRFSWVPGLGAKDSQPPGDASADFDPADARFNMIRWYFATDSTVAVGPSRANPLTGELYNAQVIIPTGMAQESGTLDLLDDSLQGDLGEDPGEEFSHGRKACRHAQQARQQAARALAVLEARGLSAEERRRFLHDYVTNIVLHEVGHTLGLRHNFVASAYKSAAELSQTRDGVVSGSVMDYGAPNLAAPGQPQGSYWQTELGPYDYWAVEYAYREFHGLSEAQEKEALAKIASRSGERGLAYGTDEDATGIDPRAQHWYLGADLVEFAVGRAQIARELWKRLEKAEPAAGSGYQALRRAFAQGYREYLSAISVAVSNVGGVYYHRGHAGDAGKTLPYEPVPPAKQRETLDFLDRYVFADDFDLSPEFLKKLAPERLPTLDRPMPELDYLPYNAFILLLRQEALDHLLDSDVLRRLVESQNLLSLKEQPLTLSELFDHLATSIWGELLAKKARAKNKIYAISPMRRELQMEFLERLIGVAQDPDVLPDASAAARDILSGLKRILGRQAKDERWDQETKVHLRQALIRLSRVRLRP